jgi:ABC-type molybdate transport system ATPase subunit
MIDVDIEQRFGAFHLDANYRRGADRRTFGRSGAGKTSVINAIAGIKRLRGAISGSTKSRCSMPRA